MSREDLHFRLRIPEDLKARIEDSAAASRRSMTAEIISRLEQSFEADARFATLEALATVKDGVELETKVQWILNSLDEVKEALGRVAVPKAKRAKRQGAK